MTTRKRSAAALPMIMSRLFLGSWESIARRSLLIAQDRCTPAEYRRMLEEKTAALAASGRIWLGDGTSLAALMAPWQRRASANARRLRKR